MDALWHDALGLLPYKDTFYSNTSEAVANKNGMWIGQHEACPTLHALMAVLSAAPVASADGVGSTNATLLRQLARADGLVLRPDRPTMAIEAQARPSSHDDVP